MARTKAHSKAATVHDVARLASVSAITVSRALNSPERLSEATLARVRKAVAQTGYVPNLLAGGLRSAQSRLVAALVPSVAGPVFLETIQSLTDALEERGYQLLLGQSGYPSSREDALVDAIVGRRPAGIVLTGMTHSDAIRQRLVASRIPVVETWDLSPSPIDMAVGFSHERIGEEVAASLHARGRRCLAIVSGDDPRAHRRAAGMTHKLRKLGALAKGQETPAFWGPAPGTLTSGREGLGALFSRGIKPDAIFCSSDLVALGVMTEAHARGLDVPRDLAVVGFGDLEFLAGMVPALSTVRIDGARIGRIAADFIDARSMGHKIGAPIVDIGFTVLHRATT